MGFKAFFRAGRVTALRLCLPFAVVAMSGAAHAACHLQQAASLQVINDSGAPLVKGKINGQDVLFAIETGDVSTALDMAAAKKLGLRLRDPPPGVGLVDPAGEISLHQAWADLEFGGAEAHKLELLVIDEPRSDGAAAMIGWDLLQHWDVEFDLAHHVIRLLTPQGCKGDDVAYWADSYFKAPLGLDSTYDPKIKVDVLLNGRPERTELDSSARASIVTLQAAAEAGVVPDAKFEAQTYDYGPIAIAVSPATFKTFSLGGEQIQNARILAGDLNGKETTGVTGTRVKVPPADLPQVLLGADFLRAHHVMIATDQRVVYFTYAGGPVFDLSQAKAAQAQAGPAAKTSDK